MICPFQILYRYDTTVLKRILFVHSRLAIYPKTPQFLVIFMEPSPDGLIHDSGVFVKQVWSQTKKTSKSRSHTIKHLKNDHHSSCKSHNNNTNNKKPHPRILFSQPAWPAWPARLSAGAFTHLPPRRQG